MQYYGKKAEWHFGAVYHGTNVIPWYFQAVYRGSIMVSILPQKPMVVLWYESLTIVKIPWYFGAVYYDTSRVNISW